MTVSQPTLKQFYKSLLSPHLFSDYCPNGLQIEGKRQIQKIAFAVSATQDSVQQSVNNHADALVTHHGLFWNFHGVRTITGPFAKRIIPLIKNEINLFAYHLPLDAHIEIGNAATLGKRINLQDQQSFGNYKGCPTGTQGKLTSPVSAKSLQLDLEKALDHKVLLATQDENQLISSVGIITGGANSDWKLSLSEGLDAYITGEMSEHDWHESKESGVHMFAGGHHATEQFGIQALMQQTRDHLDVDCFYIDSENPA